MAVTTVSNSPPAPAPDAPKVGDGNPPPQPQADQTPPPQTTYKDPKAYEGHLNAIADTLGKGADVKARTLSKNLEDPETAAHYKFMVNYKRNNGTPDLEKARVAVNKDIVNRVPNVFTRTRDATERYENSLNALASNFKNNIDTKAKTTKIKLNDKDIQDWFRDVTEYELHSKPEYASLSKDEAATKAAEAAKNDLTARIYNAAGHNKAYDSVFKDYWDKQGGKDVGKSIAMSAYDRYYDGGKQTTTYDWGKKVADVVEGYFKTGNHGEVIGNEVIGQAPKNIQELEKKAQEKNPDIGDIASRLQKSVYERETLRADLPTNRSDILAHPEKYGTDQKGSAIMELMNAKTNLFSNEEAYKYGVAKKGGYSNDIQSVGKQIDESIAKLSEDDAVSKWVADTTSRRLQEIVQDSPVLKDRLPQLFKDVQEHAAGLEKSTPDTKGEKFIDELRGYFGSAGILNTALGTNGKDLVEDLSIHVKGSPRGDAVIESFRDEFQNDETLAKLVKGGKSPEDAMHEMTSRASLYLAFGSPPDAVDQAMNNNLNTYYLGGVGSPDDLKDSGLIDKDGNFNEDVANKALDELRKNAGGDDRFPFKDELDHTLSNGQIIAASRSAWDIFRGLAKGSRGLAKGGFSGFLKDDNVLSKTYGAGALHSVSAMFGMAAMVAKAAKPDATSLDKAGAFGSGLQAVGLLGEAFGLNYSTEHKDYVEKKYTVLKAQWEDYRKNPGQPDAAWKAKTDAQFANLRNLSRVLNASGGVIAGGISLAQGFASLKRGEKAMGMVQITQGASNAITPLSPYTEAILPYVAKALSKNIAPQVLGRIAAAGGLLGSAFNVIAVAGAAAFGIWDYIKNQKDINRYKATWEPELNSYNLRGNPDAKGLDNGAT